MCKTDKRIPELPKAYLQKLEVSGFRGIGPALTLHLDPSPGLTIVTGRNGSGKSSLAEALEVLLTGETSRWSGKKKSVVWKTGWRNLHKGGQPKISASFLIEGKRKSLELRRFWDNDTFDESEVKQSGLTSPDLESWSDSLKTFRPFLSYNELGKTLSAPNKYRTGRHGKPINKGNISRLGLSRSRNTSKLGLC